MNCTLAAQALDSLVRTRFGDSLVIVEWHPYAGDTFNINPDDSLRVSRYQHNPGQPSLVLDGYLAVEIPSEPTQFYSTFDDAIRAVKSEPVFVTLVVDSAMADSTQGRILLHLVADSTTPPSNPTLHCVVTEDSLLDQLGGAYFRVPAEFVPDRNGTPVSLAPGATLVDTLVFPTAGHRLDKLGAVVFLEDTSASTGHYVLQAATIKSFALTEDK
jgi:hypothetical protein